MKGDRIRVCRALQVRVQDIWGTRNNQHKRGKGHNNISPGGLRAHGGGECVRDDGEEQVLGALT